MFYKTENIGKMMTYAPVLLFVYNRLAHLQQTVAALQQNVTAEKSELFIFSDAPVSEKDVKPVREVREYIRTIGGFKRVEIIEREKNYGLAANIIEGVTKIVNEYGKVIVLEDDLLTSPYFLTFMNEALEVYKDEEQVCNVHGHTFALKNYKAQTFFIRFADSWGWGTWARAWKLFEQDGRKLLAELETKQLCREFDFDGAYQFTKMLRNQVRGLNDSWAIRWNATLFLKNKLAVNAGQSLVENTGFDGTGMHCGRGSLFSTRLYTGALAVDRKAVIAEDKEARKAMSRMYRKRNSKINKLWIKLMGFWRINSFFKK